MAGPETSAHYERLAGSYDQNWTYNDAFLDWMAGEITGVLALTSDDRIADVGCGTGLYTGRILNRVRPAGPILCIDPSEGMLSQLPPDPLLLPVHASAEQLAKGATDSRGDHAAPVPRGSLDALVIKEAVHHVATGDRPWVITGLTDLLRPAGRFLVVMLPTRISYPLFDRALRRFEELQPDPEDIAGHMRAAGLTVDLSYRDFPLEIPKDRYLQMVRNRYMSLLAMFDDDEIAAGVDEIDRRHPEPILSFPDRFAFVLGTRKAAAT
ncbi:Methyltransferase type 11 [Parafrankia sp. Ea1.12]|uniref:class I SAM-dependent methyltransferase n=1 Tax=Parafrankia sp. Ea1.12 TaxID=573499 RepID=UPI000DA49C42|nr:class I SAM-dependent methyltransferase [Parafrankia sp. Ea1.12]SQD95032.1 Methyltransferase type 11 [Parafrankia sp. Ea1.12]